MSNNYELKLNNKILALSCGVGILNAVFCYNEIASFFVVLIEILFLLYCLLRKDMFQYVCYYIVFMTMSLEFTDYYGTGTLYGFRETRLMGIGIATIAIIPAVLAGIRRIPMKLTWKKDDLKILLFRKYIYGIFIIGLLVGLFHIIVNDNDVLSHRNVFGAFLSEIYNYMILLIFPIIAFSDVILRHRDRVDELKSVLLSVMVGIVFSQCFSFISPFKGMTWDSTTLLVTFVSFYIPTLLCFSLYYRETSGRMKMFVIGLIGALFSSIYTVTSGGLLVILLVPILMIVILKQKKENVSLFLGVIIIAIVSVGVVATINLLLSKASILLEYKLSQTILLIQFWEPHWLDYLPPSALFRFQEMGNIVQEYLNKPYAIIFGKGIMGTCLDYNNTFFMTHYVGNSAFTIEEWAWGAFYSMHESLNVFALTSGLVGLIFFVWVILTCLKNLSKSPFLVVGLVYILFHYTYSFTASYFGIICLLVGMYEIDKSKAEEICQ